MYHHEMFLNKIEETAGKHGLSVFAIQQNRTLAIYKEIVFIGLIHLENHGFETDLQIEVLQEQKGLRKIEYYVDFYQTHALSCFLEELSKICSDISLGQEV